MKCFQIDLNELLKIVLLGKETLIPPLLHRTRTLDEYVIYAVTNGSLCLCVNDHTVTLTAGDIYLFDIGEYQTPVKSSFCEYYYIHFHSGQIHTVELDEDDYKKAVQNKYELCMRTDTFTPKCYDFLKILIRQSNHITDTELFRLFTETLQNNILNTGYKNPEKRFALSVAIANILLKLESCYLCTSQGLDSKPEKTYDTARKIAEYIEAHCSEPISGEDIERNFSLTFNHANRVFRKVMGCTIFRYRNIVRIQYAKAKLRTSNTAIGNIADELGFDNSYYFSRIFRQMEGLSPSDYKRKFMRILQNNEETKE